MKIRASLVQLEKHPELIRDLIEQFESEGDENEWHAAILQNDFAYIRCIARGAESLDVTNELYQFFVHSLHVLSSLAPKQTYAILGSQYNLVNKPLLSVSGVKENKAEVLFALVAQLNLLLNIILHCPSDRMCEFKYEFLMDELLSRMEPQSVCDQDIAPLASAVGPLCVAILLSLSVHPSVVLAHRHAALFQQHALSILANTSGQFEPQVVLRCLEFIGIAIRCRCRNTEANSIFVTSRPLFSSFTLHAFLTQILVNVDSLVTTSPKWASEPTSTSLVNSYLQCMLDIVSWPEYSGGGKHAGDTTPFDLLLPSHVTLAKQVLPKCVSASVPATGKLVDQILFLVLPEADHIPPPHKATATSSPAKPLPLLPAKNTSPAKPALPALPLKPSSSSSPSGVASATKQAQADRLAAMKTAKANQSSRTNAPLPLNPPSSSSSSAVVLAPTLPLKTATGNATTASPEKTSPLKTAPPLPPLPTKRKNHPTSPPPAATTVAWPFQDKLTLQLAIGGGDAECLLQIDGWLQDLLASLAATVPRVVARVQSQEGLQVERNVSGSPVKAIGRPGNPGGIRVSEEEEEEAVLKWSGLIQQDSCDVITCLATFLVHPPEHVAPALLTHLLHVLLTLVYLLPGPCSQCLGAVHTLCLHLSSLLSSSSEEAEQLFIYALCLLEAILIYCPMDLLKDFDYEAVVEQLRQVTFASSNVFPASFQSNFSLSPASRVTEHSIVVPAVPVLSRLQTIVALASSCLMLLHFHPSVAILQLNARNASGALLVLVQNVLLARDLSLTTPASPLHLRRISSVLDFCCLCIRLRGRVLTDPTASTATVATSQRPFACSIPAFFSGSHVDLLISILVNGVAQCAKSSDCLPLMLSALLEVAAWPEYKAFACLLGPYDPSKGLKEQGSMAHSDEEEEEQDDVFTLQIPGHIQKRIKVWLTRLLEQRKFDEEGDTMSNQSMNECLEKLLFLLVEDEEGEDNADGQLVLPFDVLLLEQELRPVLGKEGGAQVEQGLRAAAGRMQQWCDLVEAARDESKIVYSYTYEQHLENEENEDDKQVRLAAIAERREQDLILVLGEHQRKLLQLIVATYVHLPVKSEHYAVCARALSYSLQLLPSSTCEQLGLAGEESLKQLIVLASHDLSSAFHLHCFSAVLNTFLSGNPSATLVQADASIDKLLDAVDVIGLVTKLMSILVDPNVLEPVFDRALPCLLLACALPRQRATRSCLVHICVQLTFETHSTLSASVISFLNQLTHKSRHEGIATLSFIEEVFSADQSSRAAANFFYTTDTEALIDILLRLLDNTDTNDAMVLNVLKCFAAVLTWPPYKDAQYKADMIVDSLVQINNNYQDNIRDASVSEEEFAFFHAVSDLSYRTLQYFADRCGFEL